MAAIDPYNCARLMLSRWARHSQFRWMALGLCGMLTACEKPDVAACEQFIQAGIKAPSTYRRISVESYDTQTTRKQFWIDAGLPDPINDPSPTVRTMVRLQDAGQITRRSMYIAYDADNGMGVPIRQTGACTFKLVDGQLPDPDQLKSAAEDAAVHANDPLLVEQGLLPPDLARKEPKLGFGCCFR